MNKSDLLKLTIPEILIKINGLEESNRQLKELVKSLENPWIRVEDRLPDVIEDVLCTGYEYIDEERKELTALGYEIDINPIEICCRSKVDCKNDPTSWVDASFIVTLWTPLPIAPRELINKTER